MSFTLIHGSFRKFVELVIQKEHRSIFLASPPRQYKLLLMPTPRSAVINPGEFYVEEDKGALKYTVLDLLGNPVEGWITIQDIPNLKGKIRKKLKLIELEPLFLEILGVASTRRHTTAVYQQDPLSNYRKVVENDIRRQFCLVEDALTLNFLVNYWLDYQPTEGLDFAQGIVGADIFSGSLSEFVESMQKFLLQSDAHPEYGAIEKSDNLVCFSFAYLMQIDNAEPGKYPWKPAALVLFCRRSAPNIFMLFHIENPMGSIAERSVTCVTPTMLLSDEIIKQSGSLSEKLGLKFSTVDTLDGFTWNRFIRNPRVSKLIASLFFEDCVWEDRLALLTGQYRKMLSQSNPGFLRRDPNSPFQGNLGSLYCQFTDLHAFLQEVDVPDHKEIARQMRAALSALRSSNEFSRYLLGLRAVVDLSSFDTDCPVKVLTLLQELCSCCHLLLRKDAVPQDRIDRALMILSVQYTHWCEMVDHPFIKDVKENLLIILKELKQALPWVIEVEDDIPKLVPNVHRFPVKKPSPLLSPAVLARAADSVVSNAKFREHLAALTSLATACNQHRDYGLLLAFCAHCKAIISDESSSGAATTRDAALRLLITQYANWHAMIAKVATRDSAKEASPLIAALLDILKTALDAQLQQQGGRFRLVAVSRAVSPAAFYRLGPATTELDLSALSLRDPTVRSGNGHGFLRPGYTQSI